MIVEAVIFEHLAAVRTLWAAYWSEMGFAPSFQGFAEELAGLPGKYAPPGGRILLALQDVTPAGAVAFRRVDATCCEAKRLYVAPEFRALGIGQLLMERLFEEAGHAGYRRLVGDTMPSMERALALYERVGFCRCSTYDGATPGAICIERRFD